ncbi:MAG TPA: hypothetical protein VM840_10835, partial [Actinomycetota bacterium]|nr:hypothetical protein [Actinomycetota bacterium]
MTRRATFLMTALLMLLAACGEGAKVGNERLLEGVEGGGSYDFATPPPVAEDAPGALDVGAQATPPPAQATPAP